MAKFDVTVIGAGLGGLAAAALLARQGKKVVVLDLQNNAGKALGSFEHEGFHFSAMPEIAYGFEQNGSVSAVASVLGISLNVATRTPSCQIALPGRRISLFPDRERTMQELGREFPQEFPSLNKFYRDLKHKETRNAKSRMASYLSRRRSAKGLLQSFRFSDALQAFFDIQAIHFFHQSASGLSLARLIDLCNASPRQATGGFSGLAEQLHKSILQKGSEVLSLDKPCELALTNNRISGVRTGEGTIESRLVIVNEVPEQRTFTLHLGIKGTVVPVGMCRNVFFQPDPAHAGEFLAIELSAPEDPAAPPAMQTLCASYHASPGRAVDQEQLIDQLSTLMPFLRDNIVSVAAHHYPQKAVVIPRDITFKPIMPSNSFSLVSRGSKKNLYRLDNIMQSPLQALESAQRLASHLA